MPIVTWDGSLAVGHEMIDEHHEHLVELLNKAYDEFCEKKAAQHIAAVLDELADYATYHFAQEELLMEETDYPRKEEHLLDHAYFVKRIGEIQRDFATGGVPISLEIISFLRGWLVRHISQSDADLGAHAAKVNKKPVIITLD
ncbi:bacteriohemerythrin [Geomonas oryzae]|uniref:bacteriohemerythrin n=1 Tax=Geomonas oryzae TaxID=2364273 RepID=UPI0013A5C177|nr:bacteriohemerythrin [Geomonas oryzae]